MKTIYLWFNLIFFLSLSYFTFVKIFKLNISRKCKLRTIIKSIKWNIFQTLIIRKKDWPFILPCNIEKLI